jgi:phospholipid transport system substrate-binding protein
MFRICLLFRAAVVIAVVVTSGISGAASPDPAAFIDNLDTQLRAECTDASPEQKLARFHQLFRQDFDVPGIARFVLGRYWQLASPSEQREFLSLFEDYIVRTYSTRLSRYADSGDLPRVIGSRLAPDGTVVSSQLRLANGGGPKAGGHGPTVLPINIDWRPTAQNGSYKITDVIVDDISMAASERSEFASVIERGGGEVHTLLVMMHRQTANGAPR